MADLKMIADAVEGRVVTQQSVLLRVSLRNTSGVPRLVPDPEGMSPFIYRIAGVARGLPSFEASVQSMRESLTEGTPQPKAPPPELNLGPGYVSQRVDNVLQMLNRPLPPGPYDITPRWQRGGETLESPPVRINVEVPRPLALSTALSRRGRKRLLAMVQPVAASRQSLLVQALEPGIRDLARIELILTHDGPAGSVATSVETQDAGGMYWVAWLSGSTLLARLHPSLRFPPAKPELAVDAVQPRLLSPGFTTKDGEGIFAILANEGGKAGLLVYRFQEEQSGLLWHRKAWLDHIPEHVLLRCFYYEKQGPVLQLVWAEGSELPRIRTEALHLATGETVSPPAQLWTADAPMLAWEVPPVGTKEEARVSIVSGPGADQTYTLSRVGVPPSRTETAPEQVKLATPPNVPRSWAVLGLHTGSAAAAFDGQRLLVALPGQDGWLVQSLVQDARHLRLTSVDGSTVWLEWLDPDYGFRLAKVG